MKVPFGTYVYIHEGGTFPVGEVTRLTLNSIWIWLTYVCIHTLIYMLFIFFILLFLIAFIIRENQLPLFIVLTCSISNAARYSISPS